MKKTFLITALIYRITCQINAQDSLIISKVDQMLSRGDFQKVIDCGSNMEDKVIEAVERLRN